MMYFHEYTPSEEELICGNKFINLSNLNNIIFAKTDYINYFKNKNIDTFITHNSDFHINNLVLKNGPNFNKWFCQNKDVEKNNIHGIPIGLENFEPNFTSQSSFGRFSSLPENGFLKKEHILKLNLKNKKNKNLVYLNFNCSTFPSERTFVLETFKKHSWVTHKENLTWQEYYDDLYYSKFVFSPRGNGVDCHRTWEALYLKTIPIVKKSIHMNEFKDLPILFIDSWDEITEEFLNLKYKEIMNSKFNLNKLNFEWWAEKILS